MRAAPAVLVHVPRDPGWQRLTAVLGGLAAASLVLWALGTFEAPAGPTWLLGAAAAVAGALAARRWLSHDTGELGWDGAQWTWRADGADGPLPVTLSVAFDLGPSLLLELRRTGARTGGVWLVLSRAGAGPAWPALRAAVYCGAVVAPRAAEPPN